MSSRQFPHASQAKTCFSSGLARATASCYCAWLRKWPDPFISGREPSESNLKGTHPLGSIWARSRFKRWVPKHFLQYFLRVQWPATLRSNNLLARTQDQARRRNRHTKPTLRSQHAQIAWSAYPRPARHGDYSHRPGPARLRWFQRISPQYRFPPSHARGSLQDRRGRRPQQALTVLVVA
jgi:hypothetical protein